MESYVHTNYGWCYYVLDPHPVIYGLYVKSSYRGQGLSRILLNFCINDIRRRGDFGQIKIQAEPREGCMDIDSLIEYYKSFGLEIM